MNILSFLRRPTRAHHSSAMEAAKWCLDERDAAREVLRDAARLIDKQQTEIESLRARLAPFERRVRGKNGKFIK